MAAYTLVSRHGSTRGPYGAPDRYTREDAARVTRENGPMLPKDGVVYLYRNGVLLNPEWLDEGWGYGAD